MSRERDEDEDLHETHGYRLRRDMSDGSPEGYLRKRERSHRWCSGRPTESHVHPLEGRGDIWKCPECGQVWIGVLRPSLLDAVPHWAIKWKRMCSLRAWACTDLREAANDGLHRG